MTLFSLYTNCCTDMKNKDMGTARSVHNDFPLLTLEWIGLCPGIAATRSVHSDFPLLTLEWIGLCPGIAATVSHEFLLVLHFCSIIVSASRSHSFFTFFFWYKDRWVVGV
ncbi:uncharacterized protein TM35_000122900 [Trypanosoma theileri]|uniref:Uncharacterized protein n=1 Tax=Trypanosoma theileri TaxID=67003 RepID=A0A1X0NXV7_9TRYP|nr:uncharacterized protein TM35_000122900 [Trypanosoma theileri]ORC89515.1 hypothetical protein TM35_000122900 [Trypanosoma theileri]